MLNEILTDFRSVEDYTVKFDVDSRQLKTAILDIGVILKKSAMGKVFALKYDGTTFSLRATTALQYVATVDIVGEAPTTEFEIVCAYEDITDIIPGTGTITVSLSQQHFDLDTKISKIGLRVSIAEVTPEPPKVGEEVEIRQGILLGGLKRLTGLTTISNAYKSYSTISLKENIMQLRFPTLWIETASSIFDMNLSMELAQTLMHFINDNSTITARENNNYVILSKRNSDLYIPISEHATVTPIENLLTEYSYSGIINFDGSVSRLKNLLKAAGKSDANIHVYDEGMKVSVITSTMETIIDIGKPDGNIIDKFTIRLEFLVNILPLLGGQCEVYRKDNNRCFVNPYVKILIASM